MLSTAESLRAMDLKDAIYFWMHNTSNGEFSQWYPKPFEADGQLYPTAEHYMMCAKARLFGDAESEEKIRQEHVPAKVRDLGRKIAPFDGQIWDQHKFELVMAGNRAKFRDPALREVMRKTGDRFMVEASPEDRIWGIGFSAEDAPKNVPDWGENLMGKVMMQVRNEIRQELAAGRS